MKIAARFLPLALLLLYAARAAPALACAILPPEQVAQKRIEQLEKMKVEVRALKDEADLVFVGYLLKLTHHDVTVDAPSGPPTVMRMHQASFLDASEIKGKYPAGGTLAFATNRSRVEIGCGRSIRESLPVEKDIGYSYLVYAKAGQILRINRIPDFQLMDGRQEAAFLQSLD